MAADWGGIAEELREIFKTQPAARVETWLASLGESELGRYLGSCIVMDVRAKNIGAEVFARVFEDVDVNAPDPVHEFGRAVDRLEPLEKG